MRFVNNGEIVLLISILVLFGCSTKQPILTSEQIQQQMLEIDHSNGIDKREAIILAQNHLLKNPPDQSANLAKKDIDINRFEARELNDRYKINFDFKFDDSKPFMYPFYWSVIVDKKSGHVLSSSFDGHK
jgi:hypothetical protein